MDDNARRCKRKRDLQLDDAFLYGGGVVAELLRSEFLYGGGVVAEVLRSEITRVRVGPHVKDIPSKAFKGCTNLVQVQFYEGLEVIGDQAFRDCKALQEVTIPSSVTMLGGWAFQGCINLAKVQFNEGLQIIEHNAFQECKALVQVIIPSSVTELGYGAFYNCVNLSDVQFHAWFHDGLKNIGGRAFFNCVALRRVSIPSSVTNLGYGAFERCTNLTNVQLNEGLQDIGNEAFAYCMALQQVSIPSTVAKMGHRSFYSCTNLVSVKINKGVQKILTKAFEDCKALRSVTIPSTVTKLGGLAFQDCINLREVRLKTVPKLSKWAFNGCTNLSEVIFLRGERLINLDFLDRDLFSEEPGLLNQRSLNALVNTGRESAFRLCSSLTTVKISVQRVSERMARLPQVCRLSVEERIDGLGRLELKDGNVLACFPIVAIRGGHDVNIQDTNIETAKSLHQVLQLMAFHELKEASILIELAMWKSNIDGKVSARRADCRVSIPDPAKYAIMEYCGFAGFLVPSID